MSAINPNVQSATRHGAYSIEHAPDATLVVHLSGEWHLGRDLPSADDVARELVSRPAPGRVIFNATDLGRWDSGLVAFLTQIHELCHGHGISEDRSGLPAGVRRLLDLAEAVPEKPGVRGTARQPGFFTRVGEAVIHHGENAADGLAFVGDLTLAIGRLIGRAARFRYVDLAQNIQDCGPSAVGIVTLISFLVGVILAFMGAVQLQQFGAAIYVADLVAIGMLREMGAMMTAIIMSGRTGAAFAAQIGTMKVTQEIDALTTMGISPFQFLVLPRLIALVLMMPLLCLYSDLMGIMGGAFVGITMLNLSLANYLRETTAAVTLTYLAIGVVKATVYGALIAIAGCMEGFRCGSSSSAVGDAATRAVVRSIVMVVVACGIFAFITNILNI
jgi:phospholipid/cholesterol/gamma-HCH transport system permease protein